VTHTYCSQYASRCTRQLIACSIPIMFVVTVPRSQKRFLLGRDIFKASQPREPAWERHCMFALIMEAAATSLSLLLYVRVLCTLPKSSKMTLLHIESDRIAQHDTGEWDSTLHIPATEVLGERLCSIIQMSLRHTTSRLQSSYPGDLILQQNYL